MDKIGQGVISGANQAITLSIALMGTMGLWNGVACVLDKAGFTKLISKLLLPFLKILFPNSCKNGNAAKEISCVFAANFLGLGNAALPMGIKAMQKLNNYNLSKKGYASNEMVLLAVINTVPFQLIPNTLISLKSAFNSKAPFEIIVPIWVCSIFTICFAVIITKLFERMYK